MRRLSVFAVLVVLVGACAGSGTSPEPGPGRLVVHDDDGSVSIVAPDGSETQQVASGVDGENHRQPVWSPDGRTLAWVATSAADNRLHLHTDSQDRSIPIPVAAFYLAWSPAGDRILALGAGASGGVEAIVVDVGSGRIIGLGTSQPFYAAWSPDGSRLLVRAGPQRLGVVSIDGGAFVDLGTGAPFQAPDWSADGRRAYVVSGERGDTLRVDGGVEVEVFGSFSTFALADRLAVQVLAEPGGISAAFRRSVPVPTNRLVVIDTGSGDIETAWPTPVAGFEWSPDGRRLLFLTVNESDPPALTWRVWDDGTVVDLATAEPTAMFVRDYLPFFDQYARSQTSWSPGSDAVAFAGSIGGRTGIWVTPVSEVAEPRLVADGEMVSWSR